VSVLSTAAAWLVEPAEETDALVESPTPPRRRRAATWPIARPDDERSSLSLAQPDDERSSPSLAQPDDAPSSLSLARPPAAGELALSRVAVLGPPSAVPALAAAAALTCRARARVPSALVALWHPPSDSDGLPGPGGGPVLPGAAALASRLSRRDLPVAARGRLVWLRLPGDDDAAVSLLRRAEAAAGDLPSVLAVARPRDATVDAVLAERELLVLAAGDDSPLAAAALSDAAELRVPVRVCRPLPPGALRLAALAGLRGPRLELADLAPLQLAARPARRPAARASVPPEEAW
jgi:hypothetical protein